MSIKIKKNTLTISETKTNLCERKKISDMTAVTIGQVAVPPGCPVNSEMTFCHDNKKILTFSESSQRLLSTFAATARESNVTVDITHDSGMSCFEIVTEVIKK